MKALLLLPVQMDREKIWGKWKKGAGNNSFNFGLASIAAYLLKRGVDVEVCDPQFFAEPFGGIRNLLLSKKFDVIGISTFTPTFTDALDTASFCKTISPDCKIVFGGAHATLYPKETLAENSQVDFVITGEGEKSFSELIANMDNPANCGNIRGLGYRDKEDVRINPKSSESIDMNSLPRPAYDLFELEKYEIQSTSYKRLPAYTMVVSRGCPYDCSFCQANQILGRGMRYRSVRNTINDIMSLIKDHGAKGIVFQDTTLPANRKWIVEFCDALIKEKIDISWMCYSRADNVDKELLKLMKKAGCFGISFGVESANQRSLDLLNKNMTVEDNVKAVRLALDCALVVTATFILGIPGEDEHDVKMTIKLAKALSPHIAHFYLPIPYPKSRFFEQCDADGGIRKDYKWEDFNIFHDGNPVYVNPLLGKARMLALKDKAIKDFYLSPRVWWRNLKSVNSVNDIKKYYSGLKALYGYFFDN